MSKLSYEEWVKITPPFYWLRTNVLKNKEAIFADMISKWLDDNISSWWYNDGDIFVFATQEDRATFKFWILSDAFSYDYGDISQ